MEDEIQFCTLDFLRHDHTSSIRSTASFERIAVDENLDDLLDVAISCARATQAIFQTYSYLLSRSWLLAGLLAVVAARQSGPVQSAKESEV